MKIKINQNIFKIKTLLDKKSHAKGMMKKKFDENFEGLLFIMDDYDEQCFWMKNCIIPLDIIMIENNIISKINHNCPPCDEDECESYCGFGNLVLELEGGTCEDLDIKEGDTIEFIF